MSMFARISALEQMKPLLYLGIAGFAAIGMSAALAMRSYAQQMVRKY